jgi:hypothetical protein
MTMRVRLTKKHAERIDDVDLRGCDVGDTIDVSPREALLLRAEEWALPERRGVDRTESLRDCRILPQPQDQHPPWDDAA